MELRARKQARSISYELYKGKLSRIVVIVVHGALYMASKHSSGLYT